MLEIYRMYKKNIRIVDEPLLKKIRQRPCVVCGNRPSEVSHIKSRGSGGPDTEWNCVPKCRRCHVDWHMSPIKFCERHPDFKKHLQDLGWEFGKDLFNPKIFDPLDS